jgi:high-affinity nickel permease
MPIVYDVWTLFETSVDSIMYEASGWCYLYQKKKMYYEDYQL